MALKTNTSAIINWLKSIVFLSLLVVPAIAGAQNLSVNFETKPLFKDSNLFPGRQVSRWVEVTNNSTIDQTIVTRTANEQVDSQNNLAKVLDLAIQSNNQTKWQGSLADFYAANQVMIDTLSAGQTATLTYTIAVPANLDRAYQNQTTGFDLLAGFLSGEVASDDPQNGSGSSSIGGFLTLIISNESEEISDPNVGTVVITWQTNRPATSQVIYGLASGGPYSLNLSAGNYGYPNSSAEDSTKKTDHQIILTNLLPGQTYVYRAVSQASPVTIGQEHIFTIPDSEQSASIEIMPADLMATVWPTPTIAAEPPPDLPAELPQDESIVDIEDHSPRSLDQLLLAQSLWPLPEAWDNWFYVLAGLILWLLIFIIIWQTISRRSSRLQQSALLYWYYFTAILAMASVIVALATVWLFSWLALSYTLFGLALLTGLIALIIYFKSIFSRQT